jgi:hypothetical protein
VVVEEVEENNANDDDETDLTLGQRLAAQRPRLVVARTASFRSNINGMMESQSVPLLSFLTAAFGVAGAIPRTIVCVTERKRP